MDATWRIQFIRRMNMRRLALSAGLAGGLFLVLLLGFQAWADEEIPLGLHCGAVGPTPIGEPDFCGCTWGEAYFHGQPVSGALVTMAFGGRVVTNVTHLTALEPAPYYGLTGHDLDARRGDMLTLTASFAGQTITRTIRAWPEDGLEQHVALVFPERGRWSAWVTGGYTRALALAGDVVWAGGPAGLISISLSSDISMTHALPWSDQAVRALAVGSNGHIWAAGAVGLAEFDGSAWHAHTIPLSHTWRALAVDPGTGAIWLGGGQGNEGGAAVYGGTWQAAGAFGAPVTALTVDGAGRAWAATWGGGVYRQDGSGGWTRYRAAGGLASDLVLAAASDGQAAWFGTWPGQGGQGPFGGIARYELATGAWRSYTTAHGLPFDAVFGQAPAPVYALTQGEPGTMWAATTDGVYFLAGDERWVGYTATHGLRPGPVTAVIVRAGTVVAAPAAGLDRLDPAAASGLAPTAQVDIPAAPLTVTVGMTLTLSGRGVDGDENGAHIVAWDWSSSLSGSLCTANTCALPHHALTPGAQTIALKVQDDEGVWSSPVTKSVVVGKAWQVYLPMVMR
ncbi:MAG: hypothetical protein JXM73_24675 [Anaerolineae bacterium]|nr:hypothetical protein [Anaerolineae bacterium]